MNITHDMIEWLANGWRGVSSNTIFTTLTGMDALGSWRGSHPLDPDDFRRCVILLEQCPALKAEFHRMAEVSEPWKKLVENYDRLVALMDEECAGVDWRERNSRWSAPKTYELMKEFGC